MRFTADDAFDAQTEGDPIIMEPAAALKVFNDHDGGEPWEAYEAEMVQQGRDPLDAANLLGWLGY